MSVLGLGARTGGDLEGGALGDEFLDVADVLVLLNLLDGLDLVVGAAKFPLNRVNRIPLEKGSGQPLQHSLVTRNRLEEVE